MTMVEKGRSFCDNGPLKIELLVPGHQSIQRHNPFRAYAVDKINIFVAL